MQFAYSRIMRHCSRRYYLAAEPIVKIQRARHRTRPCCYALFLRVGAFRQNTFPYNRLDLFYCSLQFAALVALRRTVLIADCCPTTVLSFALAAPSLSGCQYVIYTGLPSSCAIRDPLSELTVSMELPEIKTLLHLTSTFSSFLSQPLVLDRWSLATFESKAFAVLPTTDPSILRAAI